MIIGLDIDNVITDLDKTFLEEFLKEDKNKRNSGIINKNAKHITEGMLDWSSQEIHDFLVSDMERMSLIFEPIPNAKLYIDKLKKDGHKIYLVTHRNYRIFKNPKEATEEWLKKENIYYDKLIFTESNNKSKECIENKVDIMFDDIAINCLQLRENGIESYLFKTRYNERYSLNIPMVEDWKDLYNLILNKQK